jgi:WD40 repeat protein
LALELKHTSPLLACRFDPTGRYLFVAAQDNSLQRFDLFTGAKTSLLGHKSWVRSIAFRWTKSGAPCSALGNATASLTGAISQAVRTPEFTLFTADYAGQLCWWDGSSAEPKITRTISAHQGWVRAIAVSPDGNAVATCGNDQLVKVWSTQDGKLLQTLTGHASHVYNVAFHPDGTHLASADLKGIIKDWEWKSGKAVREFDGKLFNKYDTTFGADIGGIRGMAFDAAGTTLACSGITNVSNAFAGVGNPIVLLVDWKSGQPRQLKPKDAFQGTGWGVHLHQDGFAILGGGGSGGRIWFWKLADATNVHTVTVPSNVRDLAVHPDGTAIATAGFNGTAGVYTMTPTSPIDPKPKTK